MRLSIVRDFLHQAHGPIVTEGHELCITCSLMLVYQVYFEGQNAPPDPENIIDSQLDAAHAELFDRCQVRGWPYDGDPDSQQDASEFMDFLVQEIGIDLHSARHHDESIGNGQLTQTTSELARAWESLFTTRWIKMWQCKHCGIKKKRQELETKLICDLYDGFTFLETIEKALCPQLTNWTCGHCRRQNDDIVAKLTMKDIPEIFSVSANLFVSDPDLFDEPGEFTKTGVNLVWDTGLTLNLSPHLAPETARNTPVVHYRLAGVVLHQGNSQHSGHYIAVTADDFHSTNYCNDKMARNFARGDTRLSRELAKFDGYQFVFVRITERDDECLGIINAQQDHEIKSLNRSFRQRNDDIERLNHELHTQKEHSTSLEGDISQLRAQLIKAGTMYDRVVADSGRLKMEHEQAVEECRAMANSLEQTNGKHEQTVQELQRLQGLGSERSTRVPNLEQELARTRVELAAIRQELVWTRRDRDFKRKQLLVATVIARIPRQDEERTTRKGKAPKKKATAKPRTKVTKTKANPLKTGSKETPPPSPRRLRSGRKLN